MTTAKKTATKTVTKKTTVKKTATKTAAKATEKKTTAKASVKKAEKKTVVKKTAKTTKKVSSQKTYSEAVQAAAKILFELRAQKLQLIDLRGISETSDFMLLATCESEAQMQAILTELDKNFKHQKLQHRTEYKPGINMRWAVFDAGFDLIVQLFEEGKRDELALDKLYSDAPITELEEKSFIQKTTKKAKAKDDLI